MLSLLYLACKLLVFFLRMIFVGWESFEYYFRFHTAGMVETNFIDLLLFQGFSECINTRRYPPGIEFPWYIVPEYCPPWESNFLPLQGFCNKEKTCFFTALVVLMFIVFVFCLSYKFSVLCFFLYTQLLWCVVNCISYIMWAQFTCRKVILHTVAWYFIYFAYIVLDKLCICNITNYLILLA
jgi:hypothetical protein